MNTKKNTVNVLYPFDDNYAPYAAISMTSLFENNRDLDGINVFVLGFGLSDENIRKLSETGQKYGRHIEFIPEERISIFIDKLDMPSYRGASVAAARLFISDYLPDNIRRIIYLDSDTLVVGDILRLFDSDMSGCPVAMTADSVARKYKTLLGFGDEEIYHNAGVILYDLDEWSHRRCSERIIEHITNVRKNYEALDQDLINVVLKGEIHTLPPAYNLQPFHAVYDPKTYMRVTGSSGYYTAEQIEEAAKDPVILHCFRYLGMFPWHKGSLHPWKEQFEKYKNLSAFSDLPEMNDAMNGLMFTVERVLYRICPQRLFLRLFFFVYNMNMKKNDGKRLENRSIRNI